MAITVTHKLATTFGPTTATSYASGSFTPSNNSFLIVQFHVFTHVSTDLTNAVLTNTGSLSFTKQSSWSGVTNDDGFGEFQETITWSAPVTTGSSMTVTVGSLTSSSRTGVITVTEFTGYNTSTPTGVFALLNNNTNESPTLTLSGAPSASSVIYGSASSANTNSGAGTGVTAGTSFSTLNTARVGNFCNYGNVSGTGFTSTSSTPFADVIASDTIFSGQSVVLSLEIKAAASNTTPADCSFLFQSSENLKHLATLDTNQPRDNMFMGWGNPTPSSLAFWFQPPFLGPTPKSTQDTNQAFTLSPPNPKTPTDFACFRVQTTPDLQRHVPTIYTAQSFVCNPTIGPPVPGWYTQALTLLNHPNTLDTNQPQNTFYAGWTNNTPSAFAFWTQPQDLLHHPATVDTNQRAPAFIAPPTPVPSNQVNEYWSFAPIGHLTIGQGTLPSAANPTPADCSFLFEPSALLNHPQTLDTNQQKDNFFSGVANTTPTQFGFWTQAPDLLRRPNTVDTRQQFEFSPPTPGVTPADCSFLFQPSALLNHAPTLDTNQPLDDAFFGWAQNLSPTQLGFWTQPLDLLRHPNTVDTNQAFVFNPPPPTATPADCSFLFQANALLNHAPTLDTNQSLNDTFNGRAGATPSALGFWLQALDLIRHPVTIDTNQSRVSYQDKATPGVFGFWIQAPSLLKHPSTVDTNQAFEFNPPIPGQTPSALWWFQSPDLLRHPPHLDTNQPRLVSQVGSTPASLAFWRQPEHLLKHPVTINTQQSFKFLPPPQPPFGWFVQPQVLLRHPVPFILGGQYSFALLPPIIQANRLIKVYFFD